LTATRWDLRKKTVRLNEFFVAGQGYSAPIEHPDGSRSTVSLYGSFEKEEAAGKSPQVTKRQTKPASVNADHKL